jgi:hypothetical protein
MSTGLECEFRERKPGEWYYVLEDWDAPKCAWDWREYATAYGPFASEDDANGHLSDNHANPGGYGVVRYEEGRNESDVVAALLDSATKPTACRFGWRC